MGKIKSEIYLYDSLGKKKSLFTPLKDNKLSIYACGITAYDDSHLGHARVFLFFDLLRRLFENQGFEVNYIRNVTDIDDKIFNRAHELGISANSLTSQVISNLHENESKLNIQLPSAEPKVTENIPEIIEMIHTLINQGHAYSTNEGNVYFRVKSCLNYGQLSGKVIEDLQEGVRIDLENDKEDPLDFALWKSTKSEIEESWDSLWGMGRPGWHIECSAMSKKYLGSSFDIHGGGPDLIFPHHENEIAQSQCANDCKMANIWLHVGMLKVNGEKMSKSLGNFTTVSQALERDCPETLRYFLLSSHYRSPLNYDESALAQARSAIERISRVFEDAHLDGIDLENEADSIHPEIEKFINALKDDFNTPVAFSILFDLITKINIEKENKNIQARTFYLKSLKYCLKLCGFTSFKLPKTMLDNEFLSSITSQINKREIARKEKRWKEADKIREEIASLGVELEDNKDSIRWRFKNSSGVIKK